MRLTLKVPALGAPWVCSQVRVISAGCGLQCMLAARVCCKWTTTVSKPTLCHLQTAESSPVSRGPMRRMRRKKRRSGPARRVGMLLGRFRIETSSAQARRRSGRPCWRAWQGRDRPVEAGIKVLSPGLSSQGPDAPRPWMLANRAAQHGMSSQAGSTLGKMPLVCRRLSGACP